MDRTKLKTFKIAVFTSGTSRGSNLRAMALYFETQKSPVRIDCVVHTFKSAPIVNVCNELHLNTVLIGSQDMVSFEEQASSLIQERRIDLIVLAGFMKHLSESFVNNVDVPIVNIHPALLPKYGGTGMYGLNVHRAVFQNREQVSGATVHIVDAHYDQGRIIAQQSVSVEDCTSAEEIASRVLQIEHSLYAPSIATFLEDNYLSRVKVGVNE
ncbi:MAG: phosphoribosylglycinamide formyltransferase [Candidatus Cloacimonetes bacterium HGW-Cloacimonetes-1]|jgi:formyltetrahydrofolate-dependent phosphoribosylglycinamide formyltransferase|nr:MAG: phosphoribosylglycinamide formyltransferase [Candidatus Cloacimonetes bacterium HGW-Cloacimonetes-1]